MQDIDKEVLAWRSQLLKGTLELAVLLLLRDERRYGLQFVELLTEAAVGVSEGSIYPLLARLRAEGKVSSQWIEEGSGHAHKYYELTKRGRLACDAMLAAWNDYVASMAGVANRAGSGTRSQTPGGAAATRGAP